jgi:hypothetical protein
MNATPPEARTEYSRAIQPSGSDSGSSPKHESTGETRGSRHPGKHGNGASPAPPAVIRGAILCGGLLGALLLLVAEFTTLFEVRTSAGSAAIKSVGTGSHDTYALVPIAVLVVALSIAVYTAVSRPALLSIGILAVITLLIALLGDLPDAHASGIVGGGAQHYVAANSAPSAGLYMETLGGVVLLITSVCGFLLLGSPSRPRRRSSSTRRNGNG